MADIDSVRNFLSQYGISVREFSVKTPTAETAAAALGCSPAEIAKSILLLVGGRPVLVVTSGDMKVNSSRLKQATGLSGKVKLPDYDEVVSHTGYAPGGVCPFLLPRSLPVYLDFSLKRFATIFPAAGSDSSAVPIDFASLTKLTGGRVAEICIPI